MMFQELKNFCNNVSARKNILKILKHLGEAGGELFAGFRFLQEP
jgi:hypothetical protein